MAPREMFIDGDCSKPAPPCEAPPAFHANGVGLSRHRRRTRQRGSRRSSAHCGSTPTSPVLAEEGQHSRTPFVPETEFFNNIVRLGQHSAANFRESRLSLPTFAAASFQVCPGHKASSLLKDERSTYREQTRYCCQCS